MAAGDITYISCILLPQTLDLKVISLSRGLWRRIHFFLLSTHGRKVISFKDWAVRLES